MKFTRYALSGLLLVFAQGGPGLNAMDGSLEKAEVVPVTESADGIEATWNEYYAKGQYAALSTSLYSYLDAWTQDPFDRARQWLVTTAHVGPNPFVSYMIARSIFKNPGYEGYTAEMALYHLMMSVTLFNIVLSAAGVDVSLTATIPTISRILKCKFFAQYGQPGQSMGPEVRALNRFVPIRNNVIAALRVLSKRDAELSKLPSSAWAASLQLNPPFLGVQRWGIAWTDDTVACDNSSELKVAVQGQIQALSAMNSWNDFFAEAVPLMDADEPVEPHRDDVVDRGDLSPKSDRSGRSVSPAGLGLGGDVELSPRSRKRSDSYDGDDDSGDEADGADVVKDSSRSLPLGAPLLKGMGGDSDVVVSGDGSDQFHPSGRSLTPKGLSSVVARMSLGKDGQESRPRCRSMSELDAFDGQEVDRATLLVAQPASTRDGSPYPADLVVVKDKGAQRPSLPLSPVVLRQDEEEIEDDEGDRSTTVAIYDASDPWVQRVLQGKFSGLLPAVALMGGVAPGKCPYFDAIGSDPEALPIQVVVHEDGVDEEGEGVLVDLKDAADLQPQPKKKRSIKKAEDNFLKNVLKKELIEKNRLF